MLYEVDEEIPLKPQKRGGKYLDVTQVSGADVLWITVHPSKEPLLLQQRKVILR